MKHGDDLELAIISRGNVRRHTLQALKLTAFLIIGLSILAGHSNTTVNRGLIVAILVLMWGGAEADDDEIDTFDRVYESQLDEGTSQ